MDSPLPSPVSKPRILIVEDGIFVARDIQQQLVLLGYEPVGHATRGEEAIAMAGSLRPDLVLMDIQLDGAMDGIAAAQAIRTQWALPVVFLTAFAAEDMLARAKLTEPFGYIVKPFSERELRSVLVMALYKHQAEVRQRESQEEQATILRTALDGYWQTDMEGRILEANDACCRMHGCTCEEMLRMSIADFEADEDRAGIAGQIERIVRDGSGRFERRHRGKEGRLVDLEISTNYRPTNGGRMIAFLRDITARKLAEQRVREQAALLDVTRDAIIVIELDGVVNYWNHGAELLYGWAKAEASGRPLTELICDRPVSAEIAAAFRAIRDQGEWSGEMHQRSRAGVPLVALCRGVLMHDAAGEARSTLFSVSDITEAKRIEEQFLRAQRLESLGSLAGGVAHDLNNVFTPIMMSLEALAAFTHAARDRDMIQLLSDSTRRGADIVRQLLLFGRGSDSPRTEITVMPLIHELQRMMQGTFPKNIALSIQAPADLWPVQGDQTQLHQVLLNLCINARDAMLQGGRLAVAAENMRVEADFASRQLNARPGPHVCLRVTDTGTGIPPEVIEKIFDPFFTTKPPGQGTGLGLATTLGIVRSHGGFITVKTQQGAGSEFGVYLPAKAAMAEVTTAAATRQAWRAQGELILVVDDEVNIRKMLDRMLKAHGYEVIVASDGKEAVALVSKRGSEIRLVITDVMMPNMDGLATVRMLRQMQPRLPIMAFSGMQTNWAEFDKLAPPRVVHLAKPFSTGGLLAAIREAFDAPAVPETGAIQRGLPVTG